MAPEECIVFSPAHIYTSWISAQGMGKELMGVVVGYLRGEKVDGVGWAGSGD